MNPKVHYRGTDKVPTLGKRTRPMPSGRRSHTRAAFSSCGGRRAREAASPPQPLPAPGGSPASHNTRPQLTVSLRDEGKAGGGRIAYQLRLSPLPSCTQSALHDVQILRAILLVVRSEGVPVVFHAAAVFCPLMMRRGLMYSSAPAHAHVSTRTDHGAQRRGEWSRRSAPMYFTRSAMNGQAIFPPDECVALDQSSCSTPAPSNQSRSQRRRRRRAGDARAR